MATKKSKKDNPEAGEELEENVVAAETVVEDKATFEAGQFTYKGKQYAVAPGIPTFKISGKVYTTEELPAKLKLVAQLIDLGFAGLVEVK